MAEVLHSLSIVLLIISGVLMITSIVLWRVFKIPKVIGDLSGSNARKSIANLRAENEKKSRLKETHIRKTGKTSETGLLKENVALMYESNSTELLVSDERFGPGDISKETAPMTGEIMRTEKKTPQIKIKMINEELIVHTYEEI